MTRTGWSPKPASTQAVLRLLRRLPYTSAAVALAATAFVLAVFRDINVFDIPSLDMIGIERSEVGEVAMAFLFVIPALFVDRIVERQRIHENMIRTEQLRVVKVTMRTVQDVVNNNLNQLQVLRLEAEGHVQEATLTLFDATIQDTAAQLTAIGNLEVFAERPMQTGPGLDVPSVMNVG